MHGSLCVFNVAPGENAIGTKNNTSELFAEGTYVRDMILHNFNFEGFFSDTLGPYDIISKDLTLTNVPRNSIRLYNNRSRPGLLGPGIQCERSRLLDLHGIYPASEMNLSEGSLHVFQTEVGTWTVLDLGMGQIQLAQPGSHIINSANFKLVTTIPQKLTEPYAYKTLHLIPVEPGKIIRAHIDNRSELLGATPQSGTIHCLYQRQVDFDPTAISIYRDVKKGQKEKVEPHIITHGTITILDLPPNFFACALDGAEPIVFDRPGVKGWNSQQFNIVKIYSSSEKWIQFAKFTQATVGTGEVCIYKDNGHLSYLEPGFYSYSHEKFKDKRIEFIGYLSTGREPYQSDITVHTAEAIPITVTLNMQYKILHDDIITAVTATSKDLSSTETRDLQVITKEIEENVKRSATTTLSSIMQKVRYADFVTESSQQTSSLESDNDFSSKINRIFNEQFKNDLLESGITVVSPKLHSFLPADPQMSQVYLAQIQDRMKQKNALQRMELDRQIAEASKAAAQTRAETTAIEQSAPQIATLKLESETAKINADRESTLAQAKAQQDAAVAMAAANQAAAIARTQAEQDAAVAKSNAERDIAIANSTAQQRLTTSKLEADQATLLATSRAEQECTTSERTATMQLTVAKTALETARLAAEEAKVKADAELHIAKAKAEQQKLTAEIESLKMQLVLNARANAQVNIFQGLANAIAIAPGLVEIFKANANARALHGMQPNITVSNLTDMPVITQMLAGISNTPQTQGSTTFGRLFTAPTATTFTTQAERRTTFANTTEASPIDDANMLIDSLGIRLDDSDDNLATGASQQIGADDSQQAKMLNP